MTWIDERCSAAVALAFLVREGHQSAAVTDAAGRRVGFVTRAALLAWLAGPRAGGGTTLGELVGAARARASPA